MVHTRKKFLSDWIALVFKYRARLATTKKVAVTSGETQEDNQNFNWKAVMKNSDRGDYRLKGDGSFVNNNYRNSLTVVQNRGVGYSCMPLVILCKYEKLSM